MKIYFFGIYIRFINYLYGVNNVEVFRVDMINDGVEDFRVVYIRMIY